MAFVFILGWILAFTSIRVALWSHPEGSYISPAVALCVAIIIGGGAFVFAWRIQHLQGSAPFIAGPPIHRRLVAVEDESALADGYFQLFKRYGWDVSLAGTMADGFLLLFTRPEWYLVDIMLPDGSGVEIVRAIRRARLDIRIAVMSAMPVESMTEMLAGVEPPPELVLTKGSISVGDLAGRMAAISSVPGGTTP